MRKISACVNRETLSEIRCDSCFEKITITGIVVNIGLDGDGDVALELCDRCYGLMRDAIVAFGEGEDEPVGGVFMEDEG